MTHLLSLVAALHSVYGLPADWNADAPSLQAEPIPVGLLSIEPEEPLSFRDALTSGEHWVNLNLRGESVDQDGFSRDAFALTLRTVLGYETARYGGWAILVEAEDVSAVGDAAYNSTINGNTDRPVIADPDGTEVNQAYLSYVGIEDTTVRLGRQRIKLDNDRFIGNVGWRQN